jgi:Lipoyl protein ligase A/B catalytic domain
MWLCGCVAVCDFGVWLCVCMCVCVYVCMCVCVDRERYHVSWFMVCVHPNNMPGYTQRVVFQCCVTGSSRLCVGMTKSRVYPPTLHSSHHLLLSLHSSHHLLLSLHSSHHSLLSLHTHTHTHTYIHTRPWHPLDTSPSCAVPAYLIVLAGIQISGAAYKLSGPTSMHHGTLLLDVDMSSLGAYLNPNKLKLKSKGVDSVIARVTNLSVHLPTITHQQVSSKVMEHFLRARLTSQSGAGQLASVADFPVEEVGSSLLDTEPALREAYEKLEVCLRVISYE